MWSIFDYQNIEQCLVKFDFFQIEFRESRLKKFIGISAK